MYSQALFPQLWIQDCAPPAAPPWRELVTGVGVRTSKHTDESHFQLCLCKAVSMEEGAPEDGVQTPRLTS